MLRTTIQAGLFLFALSALAPGRQAVDAAALDAIVEDAFGAGEFPSLAVGVVHGDELVYARALGVAERASGREATVGTVYPIGSVTKVFTTTLLAMLRDEGLLRLCLLYTSPSPRD